MTRNEFEMNLFDYYARHVWPLHRLFVMSGLSKRCAKCAVSEKFSPFNKDGICNICTTASSEKPTHTKEELAKMESEVDEIIASYEGRGRGQFDAIVLFSGGKDSIYLLHIIRQKYPKLRVLALMIDNTFIPENVKQSALKILAKFGVASIIVRPSEEFYNKVFRHAFLNLGKRFSATFVDQFDGDILHDVARNVAVRYKVPLVLSGCQAVQVERYVGIKTYEWPREYEEGRREECAGFRLRDFLSEDDLGYFWDGTKWPKEDLTRVIFPFYASNYNEKEILETVEKLGLLSKKKASPLATNHALLPLMGAVDMKNFGYSSYEPEFGNLIRKGQADYQFWRAVFEMQEYAMKNNKFVSGSVDAALKRLSLTRQDLGLS